jgi:hypothetical protein
MDLWLKDILGDRDPLDVRVEELEFSVRVLNCFFDESIRTLRDLVTKSEAELLRTPNFGRKSLHEVKELLGLFGLELRKTTSLSIEEQMTHAMARIRAAKVAYAEAVQEVNRLADQMTDEDLEGIMMMTSPW